VKSRRKLIKLNRRYGWSVRDAVLAVKVVISFLQITLSMPSMNADFVYPEKYIIFLNRVNFVNVDFLSVIGVQCMVDVDFRLSVLMSLMIPVGSLFVVILLYIKWTCNLAARLRKYNLRLKTLALNKLFDLGDYDQSGSIDEFEFFKLMDTASSHKLHHKLTLKELPVLMLNMGGERQIDAATTDVVIYREEFIKALLSEENPVHKVVSTEKVILWVKKNSIFSFCASLLVQLCLMFHAPVSAKAFYYFDCHWLGENKALLRRDYGLACYEDEYNAYLPVAYTLLLGFALFVPLSLTTFIFIHRHELHSPSTRSKIGWLYPRFNTGSEFWEIHELMRKMVLTGMMVYFPSKMRPILSLVICIMACCSLNYFKPHRSHIVFWLAQGSFFLTSAKYLLTIFGMLSDLTEGQLDVLGTLLILFDVLVIVGGSLCIVAIFVLLHKTMKRLIDQEKGAVFASDGFTKVLPRQKSIKMSLSKPKRRNSLNMAVKKAVAHATVSDLKKAHDESAVKKATLVRERGIRAQHRTKLRLLKRQKSKRSDAVEKGEKGEQDAIIYNSSSPSKSQKGLVQNVNGAVENPSDTRNQNSNSTKKSSVTPTTVVITPSANELKMAAAPMSQAKLQAVEKIRVAIGEKIVTLQRLQAIFMKLDVDHNGKLSKTELSKLIGAALHQKVNDQVVDLVWTSLWMNQTHGEMDEVDLDMIGGWLKLE